MDRITFDGNFCDIVMCHNEDGSHTCEKETCDLKRTWERLKEIENILGDDYDLDRLRNAVTNAPYWMCLVCCGCPGKTKNGERTELCKYPEDMKLCEERQKKLLELAEADRDGRCFTSPVKVGQTVWFVRDPKRNPTEIVETTVEKIVYKHSGTYMKLWCNSMYETACSSIGKTVFLTRKDALKGETNYDNV